jgi:hypothetical protein
MKTSFRNYLQLSSCDDCLFADILTQALSSQQSQFEEDRAILKAVQESVREWKLRKTKNRYDHGCVSISWLLAEFECHFISIDRVEKL